VTRRRPESDDTSLQRLMQALSRASGPLSGAGLATRLGVTRAAVWKQIEKLRALGLAVEAAAGSGYRLRDPVELLDAAAISRDCAARGHSLPAGALEVQWQIDSTSSELARRAAGASPVPLACLAEIQTAGRGRRGRTWHAPPGGALALSVLHRFSGSMAALGGLSLAAGVAVVRALDDACGLREIGLKWPNDVVSGPRKLAGILIELGGEALGPCHAVVGVGINLRIDPAVPIDQPWTDLATLTGGDPPDRNRLAACVIARLLEAFEIFAAQGFAAFADDYARHDALVGRPVRAYWPDRVRDGIACGIDARGALRVNDGHGEFRVDGGEVSVRGAP
jgi:BirA family biotin operon repressor/biotin-[acetyl-CoA-carboxylase] ligase